MNARHQTLDDLRPGQSGRVARVEGDDPLSRRLTDLGLWAGSVVELVRRAPWGDPLQVRVQGYRLALRRAEAARVCLVPVEAASV